MDVGEAEVSGAGGVPGRPGHAGDGSLPDADILAEMAGSVACLVSSTWARMDSDLLEADRGRPVDTGTEVEVSNEEGESPWETRGSGRGAVIYWWEKVDRDLVVELSKQLGHLRPQYQLIVIVSCSFILHRCLQLIRC